MSSTDLLDNDLSLFQPPEVETGTLTKEWITHRPINQITDGAPIEFHVPGTSTTYIDLKNTLVYLKFKIVKSDGANLEATDKERPINNLLHSVFSQVDVHLQQQSTTEVGTNYPYKAYLDTLLQEECQHALNCSLFIKDEGGSDMDNTASDGTNNALYLRSRLTASSKEVELIGRLKVDLCQQDRLILNGVPLYIKLWQSPDAFRLSAKSGLTDLYKLKITETSLKVCYVKVNPHVVVGQSETLKTTDAVYPYTRSVLKTYSVPRGQYSFITNDLFQGEVPQEVIVGLVKSSAVSGSYFANPFNFKNYDCNYAGFFVDGKSTPFEPLQPNYKSDQFVEAYQKLFPLDSGRLRSVEVTREEFKDGYCLYKFSPSGDTKHRSSEIANTRLELKFSEALPETCTVIVYGKFPALLKINSSRNVTLVP